MKVLLSFTFVLMLSGCLLKETYISCIDEILDGKWIDETEKITLSINKNKKEIIFNDSIIGTYYIPKKTHKTMWIWDKSQKDIHELVWNVNNITGSIFFIDFAKDFNSIYLKGIPYYPKDSIILFNKF